MIQKQAAHISTKITKMAAALCLFLALITGIAIFSATPVSAESSDTGDTSGVV